jgi:hypothetical protein
MSACVQCGHCKCVLPIHCRAPESEGAGYSPKDGQGSTCRPLQYRANVCPSPRRY